MPFSHVASGSPRQLTGGLKSPTRQSRPGDGAPPLPCIDRFTLNPSRLRVNGFTPPVGALRHGCSRKPFTICSYEKCARNSRAICTYKSLDLKVFGISSYRKPPGGRGPLLVSLLPCLCLLVCSQQRRLWSPLLPTLGVGRGSDYQVLSARQSKNQHAAAWGMLPMPPRWVAKKRPGGTDFPLSLASNSEGRSREKCGSRCEL